MMGMADDATPGGLLMLAATIELAVLVVVIVVLKWRASKAPVIDAIEVELTHEELRLVSDALDSHVYWQLSDERYRSDGIVIGEGSDDPAARSEIERCEELRERVDEIAARLNISH